jgi:hypothetical protein
LKDVNLLGYVPGGVGEPTSPGRAPAAADPRRQQADHDIETSSNPAEELSVVGKVETCASTSAYTVFMTLEDAQNLSPQDSHSPARSSRGGSWGRLPGLNMLNNAQVKADSTTDAERQTVDRLHPGPPKRARESSR